ncbi:MAG: HEPN domain-containing protein [Clostridia bacterium]|nr:HEPN domain-containing protein [Clostridia bacterium]
MGKLNVKPAQKWYEMADNDLRSAEILKRHLDLIENTCYHCQQAVEKYLKGYLILNRVNPPKSHDLGFLCDKCIEVNEKFRQIRNHCSDLTVYAIQTRYPWHIEITERDMHDALNNARHIREFVQTVSWEIIKDKAQPQVRKNYRDFLAMIPTR